MLLCSSSAAQPWSSPQPTLVFLQSCRTLPEVRQLHSRLITTGLIRSSSLTAKIILSFSSSAHPPLARFAQFLLFSRRTSLSGDPFLWNAVIKSHSHGLDPVHALAVFCLMLESGVFADKFSFSLVLKACSRVRDVKFGKQIHGLLCKVDVGTGLYLKNGLIGFYMRCGDWGSAGQLFDRMSLADSVTYNSMIDGYVKCGVVDLARAVFDAMPSEERNLITWNSILSGYAKSSDGLEQAWELFRGMPERDVVSWNTMIDACVKAGKVDEARELFDAMPERDVVSWASMIDGFAKVGNVGVARKLFDEMPDRDAVACNAMMCGYIQNGLHEEALEIFRCMVIAVCLSPDITTLSIALSAVARLVRLDEGTAIHRYIEDNGFSTGGKLGVALIDMYSKCGSIERAMRVFNSVEDKEVDHWNAMIGGLAIHGLGEEAFDHFMEMERQSVEPDEITFIGLLNACAHSGLVKEGIVVFELMRRVHKLDPRLQHYGCVVDILSRAGYMEEALRFIGAMPVEPSDVIWRTLLGGSRIYEKYEIGEAVASHLIQLGTERPSSYVLLSNVYASLSLWECVSRTRREMKEKKITKVPGRSWIELEGTVQEFFAHDRSQPAATDACSRLGNMLLLPDPEPEHCFSYILESG